MDERIEMAIAEKLKELGYKNVEHNLGTIWYEDENGDTHSIADTICE